MTRARIGCLALALGLLAVTGCRTTTSSPGVCAGMELGDVIELELPGSPLHLVGLPDGLALITVERGGLFRLLESDDGGARWEERLRWTGQRRSVAYDPSTGKLHRAELRDGELVHVVAEHDAEVVTRIADGRRGTPGTLVAEGERVGLVWVDRESGWAELRFAESRDGGRSWSAPAELNTESRRPIPSLPRLALESGRWVVVWTESRDPATHFDLYLATSPDGRTWTRSLRVNDDREHVFNGEARIVTDRGTLFTTFEDYREVNRFDDVDRNVYFARVDLEAERVSPNTRVNDGDAPATFGSDLALDRERGILVSAWIDLRHRLSGDIYASCSADGGDSWSANQRINVNEAPQSLDRAPQPYVARSGRSFHVLWLQESRGLTRYFMRAVRPAIAGDGEPRPSTEPAPTSASGPRVDREGRGVLLAEMDFETGTREGWQPVRGSWTVSQGSLLGFGLAEQYAEWSDVPLRDFVFSGRFRLNEVNHVHACFAFRSVAEGEWRDAYVLTSVFRRGAALGRARWNPSSGGDPRPHPLTDAWFPFLQDRWTAFEVVVDDGNLDYYVDGELLLSFDGLDDLRAGRLGLCTGVRGPVEYDDLRIERLD